MAGSRDPWRDGLRTIFEADTAHEPGDSNVEIAGFNVQPHVFGISAVVILLFIIYTIAFTDQAAGHYDTVFTGINENFGWWYIIAANIFIIAVLYFAVSKYGHIRIGGVEADKEFSDMSWIAMLFSAGMGIGLMFFAVAEPMWHLADPLFGVEGLDYGAWEETGEVVIGDPAAAAEVAMLVSYFHWAFHPWAIYGVVGLGIAFFSFNRGLPMTFRSVFWPVLGERIYGWWGHLIDILAVFATIFGLATSLGIGALQINAGLELVADDLFGIAIPVADTVQVGLIALITAIAIVSVWLGIHRGIRVLSNFNVGLMLILMFSVLILGPTLFILGFIPQAVGAYLQNLPELALWTNSMETGPYEGWQGLWTVFYWGWWIAWSPFVGMFIARISRGRTVREFVGGVLVIPVVFSFFFIGTMGGTAIHLEIFTDQGILGLLTEEQAEEIAMFAMFLELPLSIVLSILAIILVTTFFVTSSDSGSLVLGHLSSGGFHRAPRNQRVAWAFFEGAVAAALLFGGGLFALRTASVTAGLPFSFVLLFMCYSIWKGLRAEYEILESDEFRVRLEELRREQNVVVRRTGGGIVTDVHGEEAGSAD